MLQPAKCPLAGSHRQGATADPPCGPQSPAEAKAAAAPDTPGSSASELSAGPSCLGCPAGGLQPLTIGAPVPSPRHHPCPYRVPLRPSLASVPRPWSPDSLVHPSARRAGDPGCPPHSALLNASRPPPHRASPVAGTGSVPCPLGQVPSVWASMSHPRPVPQEDFVHRPASGRRAVSPLSSNETCKSWQESPPETRTDDVTCSGESGQDARLRR